LHPDFLECHWLRRMFFRRLSEDLKNREMEILRILIHNKFYFELLDFTYVYKNPFWFMTMHLTLFASHMIWFLFFIFLMLVFLYIEQIRKLSHSNKMMTSNVKMDDVKVISYFNQRVLMILKKNFLTSSIFSKIPNLISQSEQNCQKGYYLKALQELGKH
jgi:hypothetical protein